MIGSLRTEVLGVNYKTAWRMVNKIRDQLIVQDDTPRSGEVEADETYVGGKPRQSERNALYRQGIVAQRGRKLQQAHDRLWSG